MTDAEVGLIGVVLGFVLSEVFNWLKTRRAEAKQRRGVLSALRAEVRANVENIKQAHRLLEPHKPDQIAHLEKTLEILYSHKSTIWESQLPILATSLNQDEIYLISRFYNELLLSGALIQQALIANDGIALKQTNVSLDRLIKLQDGVFRILEPNSKKRSKTENQE